MAVPRLRQHPQHCAFFAAAEQLFGMREGKLHLETTGLRLSIHAGVRDSRHEYEVSVDSSSWSVRPDEAIFEGDADFSAALMSEIGMALSQRGYRAESKQNDLYGCEVFVTFAKPTIAGPGEDGYDPFRQEDPNVA